MVFYLIDYSLHVCLLLLAIDTRIEKSQVIRETIAATIHRSLRHASAKSIASYIPMVEKYWKEDRDFLSTKYQN